MKKLMVFLCAVFLLFGMAGGAGATAVLLEGITMTDGWADADGTGDALMCWAAAASNALFFTGWDGGFTTEDEILNYYKSHWTDGTGSAYHGAEWFFDSNESIVPQGGSTLNIADGGGFYSYTDWFNNNGSWNPPAFSSIQTWVDRSYDPTDPFYGGSYGIMARIDEGLGHYINIWGYDDTDGDTIWITDNNTGFYGLEAVSFASLNLNLLERINENLGNVQPNDPSSSVPEPATMLLLGTSLLGLAYFSKKRKRS